MPGDCCSMPDLTWRHYFVFTVVEHVWSGHLKIVFGKVLTEYTLVMKSKPDFLKEDYFGHYLFYQSSKIVSVPPVPFHVK